MQADAMQKKSDRGSSRSRREKAGLLLKFSGTDISERKFAHEQQVARTTLQNWRMRMASIQHDPEIVAFFESPAGQDFLHRFLVAMLVELHVRGNASLGALCAFLHRTKLDCFIAASKSSLQRSAAEIEGHISDFGVEERNRLSGSMRPKAISVAEDETFPSKTCLVGIEPVSGFILLEQLADDRKTSTWDKAVSQALADLPVTVIQVVSDEAQSLVKHTTGLGANHSPDLFHTQQELTRSGSAQLELRVKRDLEALQKAEARTAAEIKKKVKYEQLPKKPRGRPPAFDAAIARARQEEATALQVIRTSTARRSQFHTARRRISAVYHPYSLETGRPQTPEKVAASLKQDFDTIEGIVADLADNFRKRVTKARKQISVMKATVTFYFTMVAIWLDNLTPDPTARMLLEEFLIPACYLARAAKNIRDRHQREEVLGVSRDLMADCLTRSGPFALYSEERNHELLAIARECAEIFQRSSSCTEGRNGQLSLRHHNLHILTERKLRALTVVHNFDTHREDGTTPASRFFEMPHRDLFTVLLDRMRPPARPRVRQRLSRVA